MKRVKIMLSAVLVMAVVAGALAFKVKKGPDRCLYQHTTSTNCPSIAKDFSVTQSDTEATDFIRTLVVPASGVCPSTTICNPSQIFTAEQ